MDDFQELVFENLLDLNNYTIVGHPFFINHDGAMLMYFKLQIN
jgi:hypothetical protein